MNMHNTFPYNGMTLVEIVIGLSILLLVAITTFTFQNDFMRLNQFVNGGLDQDTKVQKLFRDFSNEVRSASIASNGTPIIESAAQTSFIFFTDTDGDGLKERMRYFVSGTMLQKGVIKPTGCPPCVYTSANESITNVLTDVTNTADIFSYYDAAYDGSQAPLAFPVTTSDVRVIRMTLTIDANGIQPPAAQTYEILSTVRNLRD
jgi:hypothetical protein